MGSEGAVEGAEDLDAEDQDAAGLRWLFIDLNSFFASVEQQADPELRGRPVIVRPAPSEYTCAIAASYEAKDFGITTGTQVAKARRLCEGLRVVEARPDLYVQVHHRIMATIERHLPIWKVCSIDEAACQLTGLDREEDRAVALARRVQQAILDDVGECLRSSVGLAPSRFLAKTACGMKKPAGLTVLRRSELPGPLLRLPLAKYPGIGPRMRVRLAAAGITDTRGLWDTTAHQARALWNSIEGERIWRGLHGLDSAEPEEKPRASISHSHVLAREMRTPEGARAVARRLVVKCGARLRRLGLTGAGISLFLDMSGAEGGGAAGPSGWETSGQHRRVAATSDTFVLLRALDALWRGVEPELRHGDIGYVGVGIYDLRDRAAFEGDLFEVGPDEDGNAPSLRLSQALDQLNRKYGKDTVSIGPRAKIADYVGAKIAFNRIPDLDEFWE